MTDQELIKNIQKHKKILWEKHLTKEELIYLENRFEKFNSYAESYYRILYKIEEMPKCPVCKKTLKFISLGRGYVNFCSHKCAAKHNQEHYREICLKRYGIDHPFKSKELQEKIHSKEMSEYHKKKSLEKWGTEHPMQSEKYKKYFKKCIEKKYGNGVTNVWQAEEVKKKLKNTWLEKYGTSVPSKSEEIKEKIKQTNLERYGVSCTLQIPEIKSHTNTPEAQRKIHESKKRNGSYGYSKNELEIFNKLKEKFPKIIFQYLDINRYPFKCDFYIPELDLFIEYQGYWTHGPKPYNDNDEDCLKFVQKLNNKYLETNKKCYLDAVESYTIGDVNKRKVAQENNLNYLEFFNMNDFYYWYNNL
ncbi:MAG: hypothetical protein J1F35_05845 [Erysipelotrichales bacterium]|nr:hypothetical protein [Erysipelotrichales bacterium]